MIVAVTGGSGRLGNLVVRGLLARGDRVKVLELGAGTPRSLAGLDVTFVRGGVTEPSAVTELVADAELVVHLAAKVDLGTDRDGSVHRVNVEGTRLVAEACLARGVRMVHCSSHHALVLEPLSTPLDERRALALDAACDYHRSKAVGEELVLDMVRERGLDAVVVSPGTMIGPHDYEPSIIANALLDLARGKLPALLEGTSDYADARDVAAGVLAAAARGRKGERYLLTGEVLSLAAVAAIWAELTGVRAPRVVIPLWVAWLFVPLEPLVARLAGRPPLLTPNMLRASVSNDVVLHDKARDELGYAPRPLRDALADALAFYRAEGWLP